MARKKRTTKRTEPRTRALAKKQPSVPALTEEDWEHELDEHVSDQTAISTGIGGVRFISTRGGRLTYDDTVLTQPLPVIVLDAVRENTFFEGKFDPDNPASPVCAAIGREDADMAPPDDAPKKQAAACADCWANKFGTADTGRGKACKNTVRMMVLPAANLDPAALAEVEYAGMRLPVTSVRHFAKYARQVRGAIRRPLFGVVTNVETEPDEKNQYSVTLTYVDNVDAKAGAVVRQRRSECVDDLTRINWAIEQPKAAPKRKKASARKRTAKR
jgi:hypothetical protein